MALLAVALLLVACGKENESYPSLVTEMVCLYTDRDGTMTQMVTDDGTQYDISGQQLTGYHASALYRGVCGFVPDGSEKAEIFTLMPVSIWRRGPFLNFHLSPMTRGGEQSWAFFKDSVRANSLGGSTYYISLIHDQGDDVAAYHENLYASTFVDSIAQNRTAADSISVAVVTFDGLRHYRVSGE